jgi:hypothetical protein
MFDKRGRWFPVFHFTLTRPARRRSTRGKARFDVTKKLKSEEQIGNIPREMPCLRGVCNQDTTYSCVRGGGSSINPHYAGVEAAR